MVLPRERSHATARAWGIGSSPRAIARAPGGARRPRLRRDVRRCRPSSSRLAPVRNRRRPQNVFFEAERIPRDGEPNCSPGKPCHPGCPAHQSCLEARPMSRDPAPDEAQRAARVVRRHRDGLRWHDGGFAPPAGPVASNCVLTTERSMPVVTHIRSRPTARQRPGRPPVLHLVIT